MRHLHHRLPERRTWRPEIAGMCAAAARRVRAGEDGAAQFSLLSDDEARLAREEMASHYPDVLFTVTMALPRTCGASAWTAEMALNGGVPADLRAGAAPAQAQRDGAPVQQPDGADGTRSTEVKMSVVIAIDGPAATGKGTLAGGLAAELGLAHLDTGSLYREVARAVMDRGVDPSDAAACTAIARGLAIGTADRANLRGEAVGQVASKVSAIPGVRAALLELQRAFAAEHPGAPNGAVLDGRDIGTVICPDANLKIYLTADAGARGLRRHAEAPADGTLEEITASIRERDAREASRAVAPMRPAEDAVVIDTSHLSADGVLLRALGEFQARLPAFSLLGW